MPLTLWSRIPASAAASCCVSPASLIAGTGTAFQSGVGVAVGDGVALGVSSGVGDAVGVDDGTSGRDAAGAQAVRLAARQPATTATASARRDIIAIGNGEPIAALLPASRASDWCRVPSVRC